MSKIRAFFAKGLAFPFRAVSQKPTWIIFASTLLAILSLAYTAKNLSFLSNFEGLDSQGISYSKNYSAFVKEFKVQPDILVVAKGAHPERNKAFLDVLAQRLKGNSFIQRVYYKVDLRPFQAWALAYPDYLTLQKILSTIKLAKPLFKSMNYKADFNLFWSGIPKAASGGSASGSVNAVQINELRTLVDLMTAKLEGKPESSSLESPLKDLQGIQDTQYITLSGGKYALLLARPAVAASGDQKIVESVSAVRNALKEIQPLFPDVEPHLTGEPVLGADEMQTAKHDIFWAGLVSLVVSSAILILGFGSLRKTILTVIALFFGIAWSLGYITLSVRHLNVFTLSLFPMLIGLAIDFSIQFLGRYREERDRGKTIIEAAEATYFSTGSGLFTASLITALGFFAISFAQYKGIAELGVATGGSLLLCFLSTIILLPALLICYDDGGAGTVPMHAHSSSGLGARLERYLLRHAKMILFISLGLTFLLGLKAQDIRFDYNVLNLQAKGTDSVKTELELVNVSGKSSLFAIMVADNAEKAAQIINQLRNLDTVGNIQSPLQFIPQDQEKKLPLLNNIREELKGLKIENSDHPVNSQELTSAFQGIKTLIESGKKKIELASGALHLLQTFIFPGSEVIPHRSIATDLADIKLALDDLQASVVHCLAILESMPPEKSSFILTRTQDIFSNQLEKALALMKNGIPTHPITIQDLPPEVRTQFIGSSGKIMIQIFPSQNIWDRPALERFIAQLREVDPNVTGSPVLILETTRIMLESYRQAAKIALFVIVLVTFAQFRKIKFTLFALAPLAIGLIWLMGIMVLFNKSFNLANLLTLPIILGIGVAFGVYVMNRYREEQQPTIFSTSTGRSVLLSALTSIAGFASLLGVSHQGLQSLGFTMTVGLAAITIQALFVLPSALVVFSKKN